MKKKFLGIIAVFILSLFIIPSKVFAADGNVFTINIPSKSSSYYQEIKNMTMREYVVRNFINLYEIVDEEEQPDESYVYNYKEGKSAESYIEITNELRDEIINEVGEDILKGYDKISLNLYEPKTNQNDDKLVIDFTEVRDKDYWDLTVSVCEFPRFLFFMASNGESDVVNDNFKIDIHLMNKNGKVLVSQTSSKEEKIPKMTLAKNITEADDIVYTITDEDIENLGIENFSYKTFVMKFSDKSYDTKTTYVYDMKAMIEENNNRNSESDVISDVDGVISEDSKILDYFMDVISEKELIKTKRTIQNANGKDLLYFDMFGSGWTMKFELASDVTSKDNIVLNITDEDKISELLKKRYEVDVTKLFINFPEYKIYKVLNGAKQKFDLAAKKLLSFRFDIDLEVFKKSGKVYVDNKLVASKNYKATSGSTIITFNDDYTRTLSQGNHTLRVTTDDGEGTTTFTITDSINNPNTSDNISMYIGLFMMSVLSIGTILSLRKKVNN